MYIVFAQLLFVHSVSSWYWSTWNFVHLWEDTLAAFGNFVCDKWFILVPVWMNVILSSVVFSHNFLQPVLIMTLDSTLRCKDILIEPLLSDLFLAAIAFLYSVN